MNSTTPVTEKALLIAIRELVKHFPLRGGLLPRVRTSVRAVDGVSFDIWRGETLGLVGESGCGKTTLGRVMARLLPPTSGQVCFEDEDIFKLRWGRLKALRRQIQIIFQDPFGSLDPRMPVGDIVGEPLLVHGVRDKKERERRVAETMELVGLRAHYGRRYPHEFSGGQRQRIGIARALVLRPRFVICDEPVSALDVSIQSQILNLLKELQGQFALTYLFIAHNLAVVRYISDRVGVMYLGKIVELAPRDELYANALHPYTQALLSAIPQPDPRLRQKRQVLAGDVASPINPPSGCRFRTRCPYVMPICPEVEPPFIDVGGGHWVACHLHPNPLASG